MLCVPLLLVLPAGSASAAEWENTRFPGTNEGLQEISAAGPRNVWVSGSGAPWQWDGTSWVERAVVSAGSPVVVGSVAAVPDGQAWASGFVDDGDRWSRPWLGHWTGSRWRTVATPLPSAPDVTFRPFSVLADAPDNVWVIDLIWSNDAESSYRYVARHFDGTAWDSEPIRNRTCASTSVEVSEAATLRRGRPVLTTGCPFDGSDDERIWEWTGTRWATRGVFAYEDGQSLQGVAASRGGPLLASVSGEIRRRETSGSWTTIAPVAPRVGFGITVDPSTGAVMQPATSRAHGTSRGVLCVRGQGVWGCHVFPSIHYSVQDVAADPVSGTRWVIGPSVDGTPERVPQVWRRVRSSG